MKASIVLLAALFLSGCEGRIIFSQSGAEWSEAPEEYDCTEEQMIVVDRETKNCVDNTDYLGRYCYGIAIMRRCTRKAALEGE